jgi:microcystin-dependent protein
MAWPNINPTIPAGTDKKKFGDDAIRATKQHVIDGLQAISNYSAAGTDPALKTAVWTTTTRPSGANLVDRVTGYNTDLGYEEYYDVGTGSWIPKGLPAIGPNMIGPINEAKSADVASATITDIGEATGNFVVITGTTTITGLGNAQAGTRRTVVFSGALILTHNPTSIILPDETNITTVAGDIAEFICLGNGSWRCLNYILASGRLMPSLPAGTIIHVAQSSAPTGFLKANGAAVSRTTYAALFAAIGTIFGAGDGLNTFNLPDLRGEFVRGWDDSRGVDQARTLGAMQSKSESTMDVQVKYIQTGTLNATYTLDEAGTWTGWMQSGDNAAIAFRFRTAPAVDPRPRNIALLACIKY